LRLDSGNFSWPSEGVAKKTRIIGVLFPFVIRKLSVDILSPK
jgi:hypothetical protein